MNRCTFILILAATLASGTLRAQVPQLVNYQGRVAVNGVGFEGTGQFKFALVNADGSVTYWSNNGTSNGGSEPSAAVPLTVTQGLYSLLLGDTALGANMTTIPSTVFSNPDVRLRVWFNDGVHGSQLLIPDQRLAPATYLADGTVTNTSIASGAITGVKIADGAVGAQQLADGAVGAQQLAAGAAASNLGADGQSGVSSGGVILSADANSSTLAAAGYVNIGETIAADFWKQRTNTNAPAARQEQTALWTGTEMLVWGGRDAAGNALNSGGRYNPATDTWVPITTTGAPTPRSQHTAVWTGSAMIIWGGLNASATNTGAIYDPATDTWTPVQVTGAPVARSSHVAVWTGSEMVVYGGVGGSNTGGRYDPANDSWTPTSLTNAPAVGLNPKAVWTGTEMIVWGGQLANGSMPVTGGRYDPANDTWTATSTTGVVGRTGHSVVWTGTEMIVWGGATNSAPGGTQTGARYTPGGNWVATSATDAPSPRLNPHRGFGRARR